MGMEMRSRERRWEKKYIYKLTAVKKYKLTPYQLKQAIERGIIKDHKYVKNPYYKCGAAGASC
jgi:hypothetical protein